MASLFLPKMIRDNLLRIQNEIKAVSHDVTLVCVTKYATSSMINEAVAAGATDIGENKVQEAAKKFPILKNKSIKKHMIGHLQTNKVKEALGLFDMIQSVDSAKLATAIDKEAARLKRPVEILIEVNTSNEPQKYGVSLDYAITLIKETSRMEYLRILGLMTIAPLTDNAENIRSSFCSLRILRDEVLQKKIKNVQMKYLSMGMSSDYRIALEEGSNMVRIGSAIFKNE